MSSASRSARGASAFGPSMPRHARGSMVARPWRGFTRGLVDAVKGRGHSHDTGANTGIVVAAWEQAARARRRVLLALIVLSTALSTTVLAWSQPTYEHPALQWAQIGLFSLLFAWVSAGCITAVMGFWVLVKGDKHALSKNSVSNRPLSPSARTAVIMPICNEDVSTVFAGLRATCESLATTGADRLFDVFILSDSSDPAVRAAELAAWSELRASQGSDRIFYRWRQRRTQRKAGNVADFCRRWGKSYRYMVVLDADSVMSGDCLVTLVRLMETHPTAGILQTAPQGVGLNTVHARGQQFSSRVTGRLFTAGMQYWQLGEAHYWGHNAIIRVEPFMKHCALAPLEGKGGLSGEIMSHDFVEAALMRRAGYHVWLVPDLVGSYEQQPPHILAELQRDRRWCQGNLQNARLVTEPGLHAVHRGMLVTGAMAYLSAPLWLVYVALGAMLWLVGGNVFFTPDGNLTLGVLGLWAGTIAMLVLPRLLGVVALVMKDEQRFYGGTGQLVKSAFIEFGLSAMQAPLRMVAHTIFVVAALTGLKLEWKSPPREATDVSWQEARQSFAKAGLTVVAIAAVLALVHPPALLWLLPVGIPLVLAIPFTVLTSRTALGEKVRQSELLLVPEESWTPSVLRRAWNYAQQPAQPLGWTEVLENPRLCAVVSGAMGSRRTSQGLRGHARRERIEQLATQGLKPTPAEVMRFFSEPGSLQQLRAAVLFPRAGAESRLSSSSQA
ncbi:MAG: glucans biosynthesis glucosyltransferase MdoH [Rubrivivax sp.]|nr:MAG: glucans biosynthesis glucosyltransferase MdoH [Rubrivivax sp.]